METFSFLWQQSRIKAVVSIALFIGAACLVALGIANYYWEGTGDEGILLLMIVLVQLPVLFLYWYMRLFWRDALLVMGGSDMMTLAGNAQSQVMEQSRAKLLKTKFFLLAALIVGQILITPVIYLMVNRGLTGILTVVCAAILGGLLTAMAYVFDFFWVNRIKSAFKDIFAGVFILGLFFLVSMGSYILLGILSALIVIFVTIAFAVLWRNYSG